jgi:hypothetical protein
LELTPAEPVGLLALVLVGLLAMLVEVSCAAELFVSFLSASVLLFFSAEFVLLTEPALLVLPVFVVFVSLLLSAGFEAFGGSSYLLAHDESSAKAAIAAKSVCRFLLSFKILTPMKHFDEYGTP